MERMQIAVETRKAKKKGAARAIRRSGKIPAVIYGECEPTNVSVNEKEWLTRFRNVGGNTILTLQHEGKDIRVLVKDVQDDILSDRVFHIDFYAIRAGKKLQTMIPIHLSGSAIGVREGGILEQKLEELEIVCLPKDLPSHFDVDISNLGIGDSLHVANIQVPDAVEVRTEEGLTVVVISQASSQIELVSEEEEEEGTED